MGISIQERVLELYGKKTYKIGPYRLGRFVFRNDPALIWSQNDRLRRGWIVLAIYLAVLIALVVLNILPIRWSDFPMVRMFMLVMLVVYSIGQIGAIWSIRTANLLPVIHANGILRSTAYTFYIVRIFLPYQEIKCIVRRKQWVLLYPQNARRKYAIRIEELGEEGYEILMDLFDGTYPKGGSPKLNVYTGGGPITSQESRD